MKDFFADLRHSGDPLAEVERFLRAAGKSATWQHCQAVAVQGRELAARFELDLAQVNLVASCHDLATVVPPSQAVAVAQSLGLQPDPVQRAAPILLHGPIAAAVLPARLGITDPPVLDAVRYHTTCRPGAGPIELALFVADKIALDPQSPVSDFVPAVREAARYSLEKAAWVYCDWVLTVGPQLGWVIDPRLEAAHSDLLAQLGAGRG